MVVRLDVCSLIDANFSHFTALQRRESHPVHLVQWQEIRFLHPPSGSDGFTDIIYISSLNQEYWPVPQPAGNDAATEDFDRSAQLLFRENGAIFATDPTFCRRWYHYLDIENAKRERLVGTGWTALDRIRRHRSVREAA